MAEQQATDPLKTGNQGVDEGAGTEGSASTGGESAAKGAATVGGEGAASDKPKWMDQLTADLKGDESLTKFKTIADLGKSYKELEGKIGKSVVIPDEKATAEERAAFFERMGVPKKPEDYKLDKVELPDGMSVDDKLAKEILAVAHKNGVPQAAINEIYKAYMTAFGRDAAAAMKFVKLTKDEATAKLHKDLGGKYDTAIALMDRAIAQVGKADPAEMEAFRKMAVATGLDLHPIMVKIFAKVGEMIGEHAFVDSASGSPENSGTPLQRSDEQLATALYPKKTS